MVRPKDRGTNNAQKGQKRVVRLIRARAITQKTGENAL